MLGDINNKVDVNRSIATLGGSAILSVDSLDQLAARDIAPGRELVGVVHIPTTLSLNASTTTMQFQIVACDDDAGTGAVVIGASDFIAKALLTANRAPIIVKMNPDYGSIGKRFLKFRYVPAPLGVAASGAITSGFYPLADSGDGPKPYPSGFTVS
jgi:hypothetical protein